MEQLILKEVCKRYDTQKRNVLDNVNLTVSQGEFIAVMGRSGSGKTTLLNVVSTIDKINNGSIYCRDININNLTDKEAAAFRKNDVGFVFQDYMLLDSLTIRENISIALSLINEDKKNIDNKINKYASELGIYDQLEKYPSQLSGGQKQRVSIIRAIIKEPLIVFADEPTGALDLKSSKEIMSTFEKINKDYKATILMVTHDVLSASYADRVIVLKDGKIDSELFKKDSDIYYEKISNALLEVG